VSVPPEQPKSETFEPATRPIRTKRERIYDEILSFHRIVSVSRRPVEESLKESAAAVFAALDPNQQAALEGVRKQHDECQIQMLLTQMLKIDVAPSGADILPGTLDYARGVFQRIGISDVQFVIGGPRQSGKTTLLYLFASVLCRRLQVSAEASQYLLFPLNCELHTLDWTDPQRLLRLILRTTFEAVEYSSLKILPYLDEIRRWFMLSVFGSSIPIPDALESVPGINANALATLARETRARFQEDRDAKSQEKDSLELFVEAVFAFPGNFARAVGLKDVIFIIDAFEYTDTVIEPAPGKFSRSLRPVRINEVLSKQLAGSPFLVSMKNEQDFFESFAVPDASFISTEGLIPLEQDDEIQVRDVSTLSADPPGLRIRASDCAGYPGYVARFTRLMDLIEAHREKAAIPSPFAPVRTAVDISRLKIIRHELLILAGLLIESGTGTIQEGAKKAIGEPQNITVKFIAKKPAPKPTPGSVSWNADGPDSPYR
jgi:hypothetical protein